MAPIAGRSRAALQAPAVAMAQACRRLPGSDHAALAAAAKLMALARTSSKYVCLSQLAGSQVPNLQHVPAAKCSVTCLARA